MKTKLECPKGHKKHLLFRDVTDKYHYYCCACMQFFYTSRGNEE